MKKARVTSREYKLMLDPAQFVGNRDAVLQAAQRFWEAYAEAIADVTLATKGTFKDVITERRVQFYDTDNHYLRQNSYVFRERIEAGDREVTLKYRHPDQYVAQDRDMRAKNSDNKKLKFEEDIKPPLAGTNPPFLSLYSFSNTRKVKTTKTLNTLGDPGGLFPDLKQRLEGYDKEREIRVVKGFTAYELVIEGGLFYIDTKPKLACECALIVWYKEQYDANPVVVEFSFKYKASKRGEKFTGAAALRAYKAFENLQKLQDWRDARNKTKTGYVYDLTFDY